MNVSSSISPFLDFPVGILSFRDLPVLILDSRALAFVLALTLEYLGLHCMGLKSLESLVEFKTSLGHPAASASPCV